MAENVGKHILVIEDDKDLSVTMVAALREAGYIPMGVHGAREGTFKLKNQKFTCVILDLKLGDDDGVEVVEFMRSRKDIPNHGTPDLVASGALSPESAKRLAGKIQGAIIKPFEMKALLDRVAGIVAAAAAATQS